MLSHDLPSLFIPPTSSFRHTCNFQILSLLGIGKEGGERRLSLMSLKIAIFR